MKVALKSYLSDSKSIVLKNSQLNKLCCLKPAFVLLIYLESFFSSILSTLFFSLFSKKNPPPRRSITFCNGKIKFISRGKSAIFFVIRQSRYAFYQRKWILKSQIFAPNVHAWMIKLKQLLKQKLLKYQNNNNLNLVLFF